MSPRLRWKLAQLEKTVNDYKEKFSALFQTAAARNKICPSCRALLSSTESRCPFCDASLSVFNRVGVQRVAGGVMPEMNYSWTLIAICFLMFGVELLLTLKSGAQLGGLAGIPIEIWVPLGSNFAPAVVYFHQYWRLLTAAFLHADLIHLLFNMYWLAVAGPLVEEIYGKSRFIVTYVLLCIGASIASILWWGIRDNMVGASGATLGLTGVMIAYGYRNRGALAEQARSLGTRWALYGVLSGFILPGHVDHAAHIGGVLCGLALGAMMSDATSVRNSSVALWQTLNYASWIAIVGSIVLVALSAR